MENTQTTEQAVPLTNREMAGLLFNIATVLRDKGNANPWRTRAYERAGRALMGLQNEAAQTLAVARADDPKARVPFRRWQHIGEKLHAKIGEMAHNGELTQYGELLADLPPHQAGLMRVPGIGPRTADRIFQTLHITTAPELIQAARSGRLLRVPGMGQKRVRAIAALAIPTPAPVQTNEDGGVLFADEWNLFSFAEAAQTI